MEMERGGIQCFNTGRFVRCLNSRSGREHCQIGRALFVLTKSVTNKVCVLFLFVMLNGLGPAPVMTIWAINLNRLISWQQISQLTQLRWNTYGNRF